MVYEVEPHTVHLTLAASGNLAQKILETGIVEVFQLVRHIVDGVEFDVICPKRIRHFHTYDISVYLIKSRLPKADGTIYLNLTCDEHGFAWGCPIEA